jgi:hypothetical protein
MFFSKTEQVASAFRTLVIGHCPALEEEPLIGACRDLVGHLVMASPHVPRSKVLAFVCRHTGGMDGSPGLSGWECYSLAEALRIQWREIQELAAGCCEDRGVHRAV